MTDWNDDDKVTRRKPGPFESEMDSFDDDEFGGPLFGATTEQPAIGFDDEPAPEPLCFGSDDTGPMPHWTEPPTGEMPRIAAAEATPDPTDDLDVWSSFAGAATAADEAAAEAPKTPPVSCRGTTTPPSTMRRSYRPAARSGAVPVTESAEPPRREPARITIGTDPSGMPRRPDPKRRGAAPRARRVRVRPRRAPMAATCPSPSRRARARRRVHGARPVATGWRVGVRHRRARPRRGRVLRRVTEKGYRPASLPGCWHASPPRLAVYWVGEAAIPLVMVFGFFAAAISFIAAARSKRARCRTWRSPCSASSGSACSAPSRR